MRTIISICLTFFGLSAFCSGETLFVSDIDDTIKISHVLNVEDALKYSVRFDNDFLGMADIYNAFSRSDLTAQFVYLSNAPRSIMGKSHELFLKRNNFPSGLLKMRESLNDTAFKLNTIRQLIQETQPSRMILIGDNGEHDSAIYAQIQSEFRQIPTFVYIHQVYSIHSRKEKGTSIASNQTPFVTSIDLAQLFNEQNLIDNVSYLFFMRTIGALIIRQNYMEDDGTSAFPNWMDCRDYIGLATLVPAPRNRIRTKRVYQLQTTPMIYETYKATLHTRCSHGPTGD